uniref:Dermaseptin n=1 Tax=Phyllomedusa camba TaxID=860371 RepID=A0A345FZ91_9NEOB|nr:dermaseptin precursor [Phyllomedusa camba]
MAFLKKSLFLVLFLGLVSLSICEEEKRENEEKENQEDDEQSEEKRALWKDLLKNVGKAAGKAVLNKVTDMVNQGEQ